MWSILYNGLLLLARGAFPLYAGLARWRGVEPGELRQRLGFVEPPLRDVIWIQAASVGEVGVASRLVGALEGGAPTASAPPKKNGPENLSGPRRTVYVTTTTRTGQARARAAFDGNGHRRVGYFPLDFRDSVRRALDGLRPAALILIETEVWPNLLAESRRRKVPVVIVNGRISDRAFRRYERARSLFGRTLSGVTLACVQSDQDARRFTSLGLSPDRVRVTGNLKFAQPGAPSGGGTARATLAEDLRLGPGEELWVAASTAEGEETAVLEAFSALPSSGGTRRRLLLAPRRPERFDAVADLLARSGRTWIRRSEHRSPDLGAEVILLDTIGELPSVFPLAAVAFVGGTLAPIGGHNLLEPAAHGIAPIVGPHVENVRETAAKLLAAEAAFQVRDSPALAVLFARLAASPEIRAEAGRRARKVVADNAHALEDTLRAVLPLIPSPPAPVGTPR